jgi:glycine cleavage system H protein
MTTIDKYEFPDELYYDKDNVWARAEGNTVTIGLSQLGQALAGDIVFVEVPRVGREVTKGEAFMSMESGKWVGRVKSPVTGKISAANDELEWETALVNSDPYGKGWLAKIEVADLNGLNDLLRASSPEFAARVAEDRAKYNK